MAPSSTSEDQSKHINGYPPATGYPLPTTHQGYPQPYQSYGHPYYTYPNTSESYTYNTPQKPPAYCSNQPYLPMQQEENDGGGNFARVMCVVMIILVLASSAMSLLTWVIFGTEIPNFRVDSVSVSTFKITSNSSLIAKWDVNVTVVNPNKELEAVFENVESTMVYKENVIAKNSINSFRLGAQEQGILKTELKTEDSSKPMEGSLVEQIRKERSRGMVAFSLRLDLDSVFKSDSLWRRKKLSVYCEDLHVGFLASTGVGHLIGGNSGCLIFS